MRQTLYALADQYLPDAWTGPLWPVLAASPVIIAGLLAWALYLFLRQAARSEQDRQRQAARADAWLRAEQALKDSTVRRVAQMAEYRERRGA
jgi:hypothetical protein